MNSAKSIPKSGISRQIARLNSIASGPGAIKLPANITRLNLKFEKNAINRGHLGAQRFWKDMLPQVQFHNPQIPISVQRYLKENAEAGEKPGLSITMETLNKTSEEILDQLIVMTEAKHVPKKHIPILQSPGL